MYIKRFISFIISALLVVLLPLNAANAASGWKVDSAKSSGSRVILGATNGGYKSAINIPPNLAKIAKTMAKGGSLVNLAVSATGLLLDGVDWVLDPANNSIKFKDPDYVLPYGNYLYVAGEFSGANPETVCKSFIAAAAATAKDGRKFFKVIVDESNFKFNKNFNWNCNFSLPSGVTYSTQQKAIYQGADFVPEDAYKRIPVNDVSNSIIDKAKSGNKAAQNLLVEVATAAVVAGDYDADLLAGAVPTTETKPLIPAIPGAQVGDVGTGMQGGDVGAAADAAREAADSARKQAEAARDAATTAAEEARRLNDEAKDLINSSIDQAIKDAATAAAAAAAKDFAEAQEVANAAAIESAKAAAEAVRAAEAKTAEAVRAADAATAARDAAIAAGQSAEAIAAAEAKAAEAVAARDAAIAAAEAAKKAAAAADAAKPEAKPFELPAFCSWATPVCDAVDWLMKPAPDLDDDTALDIDADDVQPVGTDINFGGSCPANFEVNSSIFGNPINITLFETSKFCSFLSTFVKFPVYAASSLFALYILGGRKDV